MSTSLIDNLDYRAARFLDSRQGVATLAALRAVTESSVPDGFRAYCAETALWYEYNSSNTPDTITGKWRAIRTEVAQKPGDRTDIPMSQKAVTEAFAASITDEITDDKNTAPSNKAVKEMFDNLKVIKRDRLADYIVQPRTGRNNLYAVSDYIFQDIRYYPEFVLWDVSRNSHWGTTPLIEVKPNTTYYINKFQHCFEFDEDFNRINQISVSTASAGYAAETITTSEKTRYIAFNIYVGFDDETLPHIMPSIYYIIEGNEPDDTIPLKCVYFKDIPVDEFCNQKRRFIPYIEDNSISKNQLDEDLKKEIESPRIEIVNNTSQWEGKRLLAIGDSITANGKSKWQYRVGELLKMNVRTHAKGGIGIIQMVDGDDGESTPEGYDPDNFGTSEIYALGQADVTDVDVIILMGFYNERNRIISAPGEIDYMYPTQNTFIGRLNYAVKRVHEELTKAGNQDCKVVICSAHKYGKYQYIDLTAYEDGDRLFELTKLVADHNSLPCIDLMHCGNINRYNWDMFQSSNTPCNPKYIPASGQNEGTNMPFASIDNLPLASANKDRYATVGTVENYKTYYSDGNEWSVSTVPYPWNADQLHLNNAGYSRIGDYIAGYLLSII